MGRPSFAHDAFPATALNGHSRSTRSIVEELMSHPVTPCTRRKVPMDLHQQSNSRKYSTWWRRPMQSTPIQSRSSCQLPTPTPAPTPSKHLNTSLARSPGSSSGLKRKCLAKSCTEERIAWMWFLRSWNETWSWLELISRTLRKWHEEGRLGPS